MSAKPYTDHPGELAAIKQHVDWTAIRDAYAGAYRGVFERPIDTGSLAILLAHSALETGRWEKGLWNWNLGNIKASAAYIAKAGNHHQYYRLNEYLKQPNGKFAYEWFDPTHVQTRMRAYRTSADGAAEKVRFLGTASNPARGNRYQKAWDALEDDDARAFSVELHRTGYYTAQEAPYTKAVVSLTEEFLGKLEAEPYLPVVYPSTPLDPDDYDHEQPLHSAGSVLDLDQWIGDFGLSDDVYEAIQAEKQAAIAEMTQ